MDSRSQKLNDSESKTVLTAEQSVPNECMTPIPPIDNPELVAKMKDEYRLSWERKLSKQMEVWLKKPEWDDEPPKLKVDVPADAFCEINCECTVALPPDAVFNILIDPENRRVFKNIKSVVHRKVLRDNAIGSRQLVEVEQLAIWRFFFLSGTFDVNVIVDQDRESLHMEYKLGKPGFMKQFVGSWDISPVELKGADQDKNEVASALEKIPQGASPTDISVEKKTDATSLHSLDSSLQQKVDEGAEKAVYRIGSRVKLRQLVQPAISPPPLLDYYLRGITSQVTKDMLSDMQVEAARIRYGIGEDEKDVKRELERRKDGLPGEKSEGVDEHREKKRETFLHRGISGGDFKSRRGGKKGKAAGPSIKVIGKK